MSTITLTFAEAGENNVGNEIIGIKSEVGYSLSDLKTIQSMCPGAESIIYDLRDLYPEMKLHLEEAFILVIKNPCPYLTTPIYQRLILPEDQGGVNWDTKTLFRGTVKNKNARYNLLFTDLGDNYKRLPDYELGKGTIYNYRMYPEIKSLFECMFSFPNGPPTVIEANYYYDVNKTYIGYHGDTERSKVMGIRLGSDFPLHFQWYHRFQKVGNKFSINLQHGDMYVMNSKAVGTDWKSPSKFTLRHAAGFENVLNKHGKK